MQITILKNSQNIKQLNKMGNFYPKEKEHISPSSIALFLKSKSEFKKRYFEDKKFYTPQMKQGKKIHQEIENGFLKVQKEYGVGEIELKITITSDMEMLGYIDGLSKEKTEFVDYKTGEEWTQEMLDTDVKMELYAYMLFKDNKDLKEVIGHLEWLDAEKDYKESKVFSKKYKKEIVQKWDKKLKEIIEEVNTKWDKRGNDIFLSEEFAPNAEKLNNLIKQKADIEEKISFLRNSLFEEMKNANVEDAKIGDMTLKIIDKKNFTNYSDDIIKDKKNLKKREEIEKRKMICNGEYEETEAFYFLKKESQKT